MVLRVVSDVRVIDIEKRRHPSKHYVYVISITWSDGTVTVVYRRYSKFFDLQSRLLDGFLVESGTIDPAERIIPFLPGKILFGRSHIEKVARKRLQAIDEYCKSLIKLPAKISQCDDVISFFDTTPEDIDPKLEPSEKKNEQTAENISEPMLLDQYVAISDYEKEDKKEVNLKAGCIVEVIDKNDTGWWLVSVDDNQGWVPSSYLERSDGLEEDTAIEVFPEDDTKYICQQEYLPENEDEIQLDKGGMVDVVQKNLDGWWRVRFKGKEGWAPAAYLTEISPERAAIVAGQTTRALSPNTTSVKKSPSHSPINSRKNSLVEGGLRFPRPSLDIVTNLMKKLSPAQSPDMTRKSSVPSETDEPMGNVEIIKNMMEISTLPKKGEQNGAHESGSTSESNSADDAEADGGAKMVLPKLASSDTPSSRPGCGKVPPRRGSISRSNKVPPKRPDPPKFRKEFTTIADFTDSAEDGIDFTAGQKVEVLDRNSSGWWFVKIAEREGWAPSTYIEEKQLPIAVIAKPTSPTFPTNSTQVKSQTKVQEHTKPKVQASGSNDVSGLHKTIASMMKRPPSDSEESDAEFDDFDDDGFENDAIPVIPVVQSSAPEKRMDSFSKPEEQMSQNYSDSDQDVCASSAVEMKERYMTCAAYEKVEDTEISFDEAEVADVIEKTSDGWWLVKIGGREGWAPESYLVLLEESEDEANDTLHAGQNGNDRVELKIEVEAAKLPSVNSKPRVSSKPKPGLLNTKPETNQNSSNLKPVCKPKPKPALNEKPRLDAKSSNASPKLSETSNAGPDTSKPKPAWLENSTKPKTSAPRLPSKPELQKSKVVQKEPVSTSKVSNLSSKFSSENKDGQNNAREVLPEKPSISKLSNRFTMANNKDEENKKDSEVLPQKPNISALKSNFASSGSQLPNLTAPKPLEKPKFQKPSPPAKTHLPSKPNPLKKDFGSKPVVQNNENSKPTPLKKDFISSRSNVGSSSAKLNPVRKDCNSPQGVGGNGKIGGELGAILSKRKTKADVETVNQNSDGEKSESQGASSVKELQRKFMQNR